MKAIITSASEVDINGVQIVVFDIVNDEGDVLLSASTSGDVEGIEDVVKAQVEDFKLKYLSEKKLKEGDEIEV